MENQIQKSDNTGDIRDEKGKFKAGKSGNPKGRPKNSLNFSTVFRKAAKEIAEALKLGKKQNAVEMELVKRVIREGLAGDLDACKYILDRLYGKARESVELMGDKHSQIAVIIHDVKRHEKLPPVSEHIE